MRRRRVVVGVALAVLGALVAAAAANGKAIARAWERRNDIPVVRTVEELERFGRLVVVEGVPIRFGVDTIHPVPSGIVHLYALVHGAPPRELSVRLETSAPYDMPLLSTTASTASASRELFLAVVPTPGGSSRVIEVRDRARVLARVGYDTEGPVMVHAFTPLARTASGALRPDGGDFWPAVDGRVPWVVDPASLAELPRVFAEDVTPTIQARRGESGEFTLTSKTLRFFGRGPRECSLLVRLWVRGRPWHAGVMNVSRIERLEPSSSDGTMVLCSSKLVVRLDLAGLGLESGAPGSVQFLWTGGGFRHADFPTCMVQSWGYRDVGVSNRVDFTLP